MSYISFTNIPFRVINKILLYTTFEINKIMDIFYIYKNDKSRKIFNYKNIKFTYSSFNKKIYKLNKKLQINLIEIININNINPIISNFNKVKTLSIKSDISKIPSINIIKNLEISDCNEIQNIPSSLINLKSLQIHGINKIKKIPSSLINLEELLITGTNIISNIPSSLSKLRMLVIQGNNKISKIPSSLTQLKVIMIFGSNTISKIPPITELRILIIYGYNTISKIPPSLINLAFLSIGGYNTISKIPSFNNLIDLTLKINHTLKLPKIMRKLSSVEISGEDIQIDLSLSEIKPKCLKISGSNIKITLSTLTIKNIKEIYKEGKNIKIEPFNEIKNNTKILFHE